MKTIVIKQNETWSELICPHCKKQLDYFHSECLFDEEHCPHCNGKIEKSKYQEEYDKEYDALEKKQCS